MDENNPLPLEPPAAALKLAQCWVSWLQAVDDRISSMGIIDRAICESPLATPSRPPAQVSSVRFYSLVVGTKPMTPAIEPHIEIASSRSLSSGRAQRGPGGSSQ